MKAKDKIKKAFEILGLPETSSEKEIKIAYRKLSLKWHPDSFNRNPDKHPAKTYEEATEKFKEIGWAKTVALKEEKVDDDYDDNNDSDYYYDYFGCIFHPIFYCLQERKRAAQKQIIHYHKTSF